MADTDSFRTTYFTFKEFEEREFTSGNKGQVATQLMAMYRTAVDLESPVILELGTNKGQATTVFLKACEQTDGQLVSVDIKDCSEVSNDDKWTFIQSDSRDIEYIFRHAPQLKNGIDLIYIDSLHVKEQVESELMTWYPYMKKGWHIYFDDVDANPCRKGNRKDDFGKEKAWNEIHEFIKSFFHTNEEQLYLNIMYGTTGLAHLYKISSLGSKPKKAISIKHRGDHFINRSIHWVKKYSFKINRKFKSLWT